MKIIKKLNNNVALGVDRNNRQMVVFGRGVGFPAMPYELTDLSRIDRTYYDVESKYLGLIDEIPKEIFSLSSYIVDEAKNRLQCDLNPNLLFTLADHLNFALDRYNKQIEIQNPLAYDIEHLYSTEISIGYKGLEELKRTMSVELPKIEAANIAMHLVNAEAGLNDMATTIKITKILKEITQIVEEFLTITIDESSFHYARFIMHIRYLLQRKQSGNCISSDNKPMFDLMKLQYPEIYQCTLKIVEYFDSSLQWHCDEEEMLYLMLHINRLCSK